MKIFVVVANIELTRKPEWFDEFRAKYDEPFEYHVTLKQPCFVEDSQVGVLTEKLDKMFQNITPARETTLRLDELLVDRDTPRGKCIMIANSRITPLHQLQQKVVEELSEFTNYRTSESKDWEKHFVPHITIARHLTPEQHEEALTFLKGDFRCEGRVTQVKLIVVNNFGPEEASRQENQTVFKL